MDGWIDDRGMNESPPVFNSILSPFGPLPCFLTYRFTTMQSRATGITDHILPLGDLLSFFIGPSKDHTSGKGKYIYVDSSGKSSKDRARLMSPLVGKSGDNCRLSFWSVTVSFKCAWVCAFACALAHVPT